MSKRRSQPSPQPEEDYSDLPEPTAMERFLAACAEVDRQIFMPKVERALRVEGEDRLWTTELFRKIRSGDTLWVPPAELAHFAKMTPQEWADLYDLAEWRQDRIARALADTRLFELRRAAHPDQTFPDDAEDADAAPSP